ncbi:MAG: HAD family hydrolase [Anaerolineaceae bacterium]
MPVKAFIFDFDGLILDSETPVYEAWKNVFQQYGVDLPFSVWQCSVGTSRDAFDPVIYLEEKIGKPLNRKKLNQTQLIRTYENTLDKPVLPGVMTYLEEARARGIKLAIASSSTTDWVFCNLVRLKIASLFDVICCGDEVIQVKPEPDLFLLAAGLMNVNADEVIVFEDSPHGITAAKAADMFCVAVTNPITKSMNVNHADLVINSLAELSISDLLDKFEHHNRR